MDTAPKLFRSRGVYLSYEALATPSEVRRIWALVYSGRFFA